MHATEMKMAELASYRLKEVAYAWYKMWEESRKEGDPQMKWNEFVDAFIDNFLLAETRTAHAGEFKNLKQGNMSVWHYQIKFANLSMYSVYMFPTIEVRVCRFVQGLSPLVVNEAATTA